ncbi:hypothetical protein JYU34_011815 [Plutella xylostella]|uniref:GPI transamidase component PIG-S n=1 Tax=Plutella xylostella TaxID=51655 RepID=A0ABQ7QDK9_PLUXY|nr:hypothetical protein JYU34_011815 [Plutella xylostella]
MSQKDKEEWSRMWASASFVGVLIIIGLPLWWKTTEVYRVSLPYDKMSSLSAHAHSVLEEVTVLAADEATAAEVAGMLEQSAQHADIINLRVHKKLLPPALHQSLGVVADDQEALEAVLEALGGAPDQLLVVQRPVLRQHVWVADESVVFFRDAKASQTLARVLTSWIYQLPVLRDSVAARAAQAPRRTRFPPSARYHIVLSVVHPDPAGADVRFDAGDAVEDYIGTFVDELSELHNFTLKSQWIHLLDFNFQAKEVADTSDWGRHFAVREDRLHLLLTKLEERLATRVSPEPAINLVLYLQPCHTAPLRIYDQNDKPIDSAIQAFMSPKWGGVVLAAPTVADCRGRGRAWAPPVRAVMGAFLAQLRPLLGIVETEPIEGAYLEPLRSVVPRRWERRALLRTRALDQLTSAALTLESLAQLLGEISNIVINDKVGESISSAVEGIEIASELLRRGELRGAYDESLAAWREAEAAFTDPSLLALLYFPDDQKYAIYIPLFLPIMFPVILSIKALLLWFRGKSTKEKTE